MIRKSHALTWVKLGFRTGTILGGMDRRKNSHMARVIDSALRTCSVHGVQVAAMVMSAHGIGRDVILRVLTSTLQRRGPGQCAYPDAKLDVAPLESASIQRERRPGAKGIKILSRPV
jgi:hypothetical protein